VTEICPLNEIFITNLALALSDGVMCVYSVGKHLYATVST